MHLRVTPEAHALGLHHPRAWRLSSTRPLLGTDGLSAEQVDALFDAGNAIPDGYRELLTRLGHPGVIPAGERLRDVLRTRGWKSHGAVVDAVSVATLRHGGGIGLHRWLPVDGHRSLVVTRAAGGERITPAFATRSRPVPPGDLVYGSQASDDELELFAWLGRRDCDSADRQLTVDDKEALLVVLGCPGEDAVHAKEIGTTIAEVLGSVRPDVAMGEVPVERDRALES
ncbi:hypothetical protein [Streptomyces sp. bgisy100]|uniref:hypothetical protein n=1 Tax=Streptomyces sp. bgisy100 TaxID=3413783 RepID=UPI003D7460C6